MPTELYFTTALSVLLFRSLSVSPLVKTTPPAEFHAVCAFLHAHELSDCSTRRERGEVDTVQLS